MPAPASAADPRTPVYVALGDSYTAGFSVPPFLPGSEDAATNDYCRRSEVAYPEVVTTPALADVKSYACSGSVLADFDHPNHLFGANPASLDHVSQFDRVTENQTLTTRVAYISMTIGGNDANLLGCINQKKCKPPVKLVKPLLASYFTQLASLAPGAEIMVMSYGRYFAKTPTGPCPTQYPATFNKAEKSINKTVFAAMKTAAKRQTASPAANFVFVDDYEAFNGHEGCSASLTPWVGTDFHPNQAGDVQLAADVDYCVGRPTGKLTKVLRCTPPHP